MYERETKRKKKTLLIAMTCVWNLRDRFGNWIKFGGGNHVCLYHVSRSLQSNQTHHVTCPELPLIPSQTTLPKCI
jgi:hypothetical protein